MKRILDYLEKRTGEMQEHPFLAWLADPLIPAHERLSDWLPCAAFFVFSFMDLNADVLKYPEEEANSDRLKNAINAHLEEDSMHWPWYLHDLEKLGLDRTIAFSEALRFLWGKETRSQRLAMYRLCALAAQAEDPILRYTLIASLEAVAAFYETRGKTGYYSKAGQLSHFDTDPDNLRRAFLNLVSGLEDIADAERTTKHLMGEMSRRIRQNLELRHNKEALADGSAKQQAGENEKFFGAIEGLTALSPANAVNGLFVCTTPALGLARVEAALSVGEGK